MRYQKLIAQVVAAILAAVVVALKDTTITNAEWINVGIIALGAVGVAVGGNTTVGFWRYAKLWVSLATAILVAVSSVLDGGITVSEWIQVGIAALGSLGVVALPGPTVMAARAVPR